MSSRLRPTQRPPRSTPAPLHLRPCGRTSGSRRCQRCPRRPCPQPRPRPRLPSPPTAAGNRRASAPTSRQTGGPHSARAAPPSTAVPATAAAAAAVRQPWLPPMPCVRRPCPECTSAMWIRMWASCRPHTCGSTAHRHRQMYRLAAVERNHLVGKTPRTFSTSSKWFMDGSRAAVVAASRGLVGNIRCHKWTRGTSATSCCFTSQTTTWLAMLTSGTA
mmetsp:Transcript_9104/g.32261  ORF Transcript_9104/g.32261 Transcript_9104/m.32261 type:complete len:218 (-) Transcript_9104:258-911(-)